MSRITRSRVRSAFPGSQGSSTVLSDPNHRQQERQATGLIPSSQTVARSSLRVTRSQAQSTSASDLTQMIEDVAEDSIAQAENGDDDDNDAKDETTGEFATRRELRARKSLLAGYGDDEAPQRSGIAKFLPLSVEERAQRLFRDSGVVLEAVLKKRVDDSQAFQMTMMAQWKNWEADRGAIFDNERYVYFLDEGVLRNIEGFNPFEQSVTLQSAIRLANITAFSRIINEPTDAVESLAPTDVLRNASHALEAAWQGFLQYCVPKPWRDERPAISLLVDLAVQIALFKLQERNEPLMTSTRVHEVVQAVLDLKLQSLATLQGWSTDDAVLDERLICSNLFEEMALVQLNGLKKCKTINAAIEALPYEGFRQDMLSYISSAYDRIDLEAGPEIQDVEETQDLQGTQEVPETQEMRDASASPEGQGSDGEEPEEEEETQSLRAQRFASRVELLEAAEDEEVVDSGFFLDDVNAFEAQTSTAPARKEPVETAWAVRTNPVSMPIAEAFKGRTLDLQDTDQRRIHYGESEIVPWDSQEPESSRQAQARQQQNEGLKRTRPPLTLPELDPVQDGGQTDSDMQQVSDEPAHKRPRVGRAASRTEALTPAGSNAPVTRRRNHRAGHYTHQPDIDLAEQGGGYDTPASDPEAGPEAPPAQLRVAAPEHWLNSADEYLYDDSGLPLHDKRGRPLRIYHRYQNMSNSTKDQVNRAPNPSGGKKYRAIIRVTWTREEALFLYREVQKVPIGLTGQPTAYVYHRYQQNDHFKDRNSNQVRDKMKDLVKQRVKNGQLVVGAARHYLPSSDPGYAQYKQERAAASERLRTGSTSAGDDSDNARSDQSDDSGGTIVVGGISQADRNEDTEDDEARGAGEGEEQSRQEEDELESSEEEEGEEEEERE